MNTINILLDKANSFGIKPEVSYFQGFKKLVAGTALKAAALVYSSFSYSLNRTPENRKKIFEILDCLNHPYAPTEKKSFFRSSLIPGPAISDLISKRIKIAKAIGYEQLAHLSKNKKQAAIVALLAIGALSLYYFSPGLSASTQESALPSHDLGALKTPVLETPIPLTLPAIDPMPIPTSSPIPDFTADSKQNYESISQLVDPRAQFEVFGKLALSSQPTVGYAQSPKLQVQYGPVTCIQSLSRYCDRAAQCVFRGIAQCVSPQYGLKQNVVFDFSFDPFNIQANLGPIEQIKF